MDKLTCKRINEFKCCIEEMQFVIWRYEHECTSYKEMLIGLRNIGSYFNEKCNELLDE